MTIDEMPNGLKKNGIIEAHVSIIYEDGFVRVVARSAALKDDFPLSAMTRAEAVKQIDNELKKFTPGQRLA
jgi:hypothetical protein